MKAINNKETTSPESSESRYRLQGKEERNFLERCRKMPNLVFMSHQNSQQEGFEYFSNKISGKTPMQIRGRKGFLHFMRIFAKIGRKLMRGRKKSYEDLIPYLTELEEYGKFTSISKIQEFLNAYPNKNLWSELHYYAKNKWGIIRIGFTELPQELIFRNKAVLFRYALVFMQEMKKDKIDKAPRMEAGEETMRVYAELGEAVADIADWLRKKGVRSQAVHPLGGLVCTPPLAGKAGMGGQGMQGCLITPEFGPRQRLAPIFIEGKIFEYTDNKEHDWIEKYCESCRNCQKNCPAEAIYDERVISIENIQGIGATKTCIDREKCFPFFARSLGCSVCIKVCPFSGGSKIYQALKKAQKI